MGWRDRLHRPCAGPGELKAKIERLDIVYQPCVNPGYSRYVAKSRVCTIRTSDFDDHGQPWPRPKALRTSGRRLSAEQKNIWQGN